jgi:glutathione S-transferase
MLTLFYAPGACSMASHIVLEESGEKYEARRMDLSKGEQRTPEYMKIHPLGRVPALKLDDGTPLTENTAILPYLGKRFGLWPGDLLKEARALAVVGFFATSVHPAHGHIGRPERYTEDKAAFPGIQAMGKKSFHEYLKQIDAMLAGREWLSDRYSVLDPYALVFYAWGIRRELPVAELRHYTAFKDRMAKRAAVQRVLADEGVKV